MTEKLSGDARKTGLKNFAVLVMATFLIVTAHQPVTQLQSSLNIEQGVGAITTSIGHGFAIVSILLLPTLLSDVLGVKYLMIIGFLIQSLCIKGNFVESWWTLTPAAILSDICTGLSEVAQYTYSTTLAESYATQSGLPREKTISVMFGIYDMTTNLGFILGNAVPYYFLSDSRSDATGNSSIVVSRNECGPFFRDSDYARNFNFEKPSPVYIYELFGSLAAIGVFSGLLLFLLDSLPMAIKGRGSKYSHTLLETLAINKNWKGAFLFPCNFHRGLISSFVSADLTKAYVTCLMGMQTIGLFTMVYGLSMSVGSLSFGFFAKSYGRVPLFAMAACLEMSLLIFNFVWSPKLHYDNYTVYLLAVLWGVVISGFNVAFHVLHGMLFPDKKEASFANYILAQMTGSLVGFGYSTVLTLVPKSIIIMGLLLLSTVCFAVIELGLSRNEKQSREQPVELTH